MIPQVTVSHAPAPWRAWAASTGLSPLWFSIPCSTEPRHDFTSAKHWGRMAILLLTAIPGEGWPQAQLVSHEQSQLPLCSAASWPVHTQPRLGHKGYSSPVLDLAILFAEVHAVPVSPFLQRFHISLFFSILTASLTLDGGVILLSTCPLLPFISEGSKADWAGTSTLNRAKYTAKHCI